MPSLSPDCSRLSAHFFSALECGVLMIWNSTGEDASCQVLRLAHQVPGEVELGADEILQGHHSW